MKKIIIILSIFFFDRATKIYLINLQNLGTDVDFYINSFLNFYLVWNTGVGFGLISMDANTYYHFLTAIIVILNIVLVIFLIKSRGIYTYLLALIIGGSLGNGFDRIINGYVIDFIKLNYIEFPIFNIADISINIGFILILLTIFKIK